VLWSNAGKHQKLCQSKKEGTQSVIELHEISTITYAELRHS